MSVWEGLNPPYATIVADPPWRYSKDGGRGLNGTPNRSWAEDCYSTMPIEDIAALPVSELAAKNAHLYLWTTNPRLYGERSRRRGDLTPYDIVEAWGFRYCTLLTWVKPLSVGSYFRGSTEHVLFGVRGSCPIAPELRVGNTFESGRAGRHSAKPAAFFDVVQRVSPGPYIELFARAPLLGWDSWGFGYETKVPA